MMLEEFTVDNFKSLINLTFRPRQVSLLLGINNAGKTNLCLAMRFLSATTRGSLDECAESAVGGRSAVTNYYFSKDTVDFRAKASLPFRDETLCFDYSLKVLLKKPRASDSHLEVQSEVLRVTGQGFDGVTLLENSPSGVQLLDEVEHARGHATYVEASPPRDKTMLNLLYDVKAHARVNCFRDYLQSWRYYALSPLAMRGSRQRRNQPLLQTDGRNLASVVYRLKTTDQRRYLQLLERLQTIQPTVDVINFDVPSERRVSITFEDKQGNRVPDVAPWREVKRREWNRVAPDCQHLCVFGVAERNIECRVAIDRSALARELDCRPPDIPHDDPSGFVDRGFGLRRRDFAKQEAKDRLRRFVAAAPVKSWIEGSESFEDFYRDARSLGARIRCDMPNELEVS